VHLAGATLVPESPVGSAGFQPARPVEYLSAGLPGI